MNKQELNRKLAEWAGFKKSSLFENLLDWVTRERDKVLGMLKLVPLGMEKYNLLQNRFEKLEDILMQVKRQIVERRNK